jgi:hypothetical protein
VAGATLVAVLAGVGVGVRRPLRLPDDRPSAALQVLGPAAVAAAAGQREVGLAMAGGWCAGELGTGVGAQLAEHGIEVVVSGVSARAFGEQRAVPSAGGRPAVEVVCGAGTADEVARSPAPPVATAGLLGADELAELRRLQDGMRGQLRDQGRADLADVVENQAFLTIADLARDGVTLDPAQVDRFTTLMDRSRYSGAVFYRPDGLPPP